MTSQRCAHCAVKLRGAPSFCPSCGARQVRSDSADGPESAAVELDLVERGSAPVASEVVFERPSGRRGRSIGLGVAVALAVAVGASVLSGGDGGDTAAGTTTTIDPGPTTAAELPTTTTVTDAIASTTSTTLGPFSVGTGPLLGEPTGLSFAVAFGTDLYVIDADTATATPTGYRELNSEQGAYLTAAGVVVNDQSGSPSLVRRGATRAEPLVAPSSGRPVDSGASGFLGEGPPGRLWVLLYGGSRPVVGYVDAADDSDVLVPVGDATLGSGRVQPDGLGGFLQSAPGGTYRVDGDGPPQRISTGSLIEARDGHVLVIECDEALVCGFRGIDLTNGDSWTLPGADSAGVGIAYGMTLSPDGRRFARLAPPGDQPIGLGSDIPIEVVGPDGVETFRQAIVGFGGCGMFGCASPLVWSSDGRWLLGLRSSDSIWAWRSGLREPIVIELPSSLPVPRSNLSVLLGVRPTAEMPVGPA